VKTNVLTELSDEILMVRFKNTHSNEYFDSLVSRYQKRLYSVAFNLLGNSNEAEEIVQETFIRVWRNRDRFRPEASFAGWVFTITQNLCKDIWRGRKRKQNYEMVSFDPLMLQEHGDFMNISNVAVNQIDKSIEDPGKQAETGEFKEFLIACLQKLPINQRQAIILRDIEGHSYKKIATLTAVSIGTVRSRLHYARLRLREMMK
jgi:RNA polymerase sigma-70 factor (ECF subfamily)